MASSPGGSKDSNFNKKNDEKEEQNEPESITSREPPREEAVQTIPDAASSSNIGETSPDPQPSTLSTSKRSRKRQHVSPGPLPTHTSKPHSPSPSPPRVPRVEQARSEPVGHQIEKEETSADAQPTTSRTSRRSRKRPSKSPGASAIGTSRADTAASSPSRVPRVEQARNEPVGHQAEKGETSADPQPTTSGTSRRSRKRPSNSPGPSATGTSRADTAAPSPSRVPRVEQARNEPVGHQTEKGETSADPLPTTSGTSRRSRTTESNNPGPATSGMIRPDTPAPSPSRVPRVQQARNEPVRYQIEEGETSADPQPSTSGTSSSTRESNSPGPSTSGMNRPYSPPLSPSRVTRAEHARCQPTLHQINQFLKRFDPGEPTGLEEAMLHNVMSEHPVGKSIGGTEVIEANFYQYRDSEDLMTELAELYSYSEEETHYTCRTAFEGRLSEFGTALNWNQLSDDQRVKVIMRLMGELREEETVLTAVRALLYIAQGTWGELPSEAAHAEALRNNAIFLYRVGVFDGLISLIKRDDKRFRDSSSANAESFDVMMTALNILCTITEVMRHERSTSNTPYGDEIKAFRSDMLAEVDGELFIITLLKLISRFADCEVESKGFPIKKMLLLLWKLLLVSLGGLEEAEKNKKFNRIQHDLESDHSRPESSEHVASETSEFRSISPTTQKPKIYKEDLAYFLRCARKKYCSSSPNDRQPGLPQRVSRNIEAMSTYVYTPLGERQLQKDSAEKLFAKNGSTQKPRKKISQTAVEVFYRAMYKKFDQFILSLMKIVTFIIYRGHRKIFTCKPEISGAERITRGGTSTYNTILVMDGRRYQAIMLKAISAILLLLLKHLKVNHIYQFEHMCRMLDGCNSLVFLIGFFRRDIVEYVKEINDVPELDFPRNVLGNRERSKITLNLEAQSQASSRSLFICINLMRVLNKMVKWKQFRLSEILVMDTRTALAQCVKVKNTMFKTYALKLLKMQLKYIPTGWWQAHMHLVYEIYSHVRLNLSDDYLIYRPFPAGTEDAELDQLIHDINEYVIPRYGDPFEISADDEDQDELNVDNCLIEFSGEDPRGWSLPECLLTALFRWMQREFLS